MEKISWILAPENPEIELQFDSLKFCRRQDSEHQKDLEEFIETNWQSKCSENSRLYNASKFRLHKFTVESNKVQLQIGLTSYKELLGTHYYPKLELINEESKAKNFEDFAFMSNCLGVGAIAITDDNYVILQRRAKWTGESPGKIDRPGGHPEPSNVKNLNSVDILAEIFKSPQEELRDEVNIDLDLQSAPKLLGVVRDLEHGGRCALDFVIDVKLNKTEVLQKYKSGHQSEADESTELIFVEKSQVENWNFPDDLAMNLTAHAVAGLRLLHLSLK